MCSNFQSLAPLHNDWVKSHFQCELPSIEWREEVYPNYLSPIIWLDENKPHCELAHFGLVPAWAADKPKFGLKTYNARSETIAEKPSYRNAWKKGQFGLAIMQGFYEPNYESGKAVRWRIKRADSSPLAVASIWERFINRNTGEIHFSFSMVTINATHHPVMKHFHRSEDEKRSIVVLQDNQYLPWLKADHEEARELLSLAPDHFLDSEMAPR